MDTIGQCIISRQTLSVEQADEVCRDLDQLEKTGTWDIPDWATELAQHYQTLGSPGHSVIQLYGWKAAARAYQRFTQLQIATNKLSKKEQNNGT